LVAGGVVLLVGEAAGQASWGWLGAVALLAAAAASFAWRGGGRTAHALSFGLFGIALTLGVGAVRSWRVVEGGDRLATAAVTAATQARDRELAAVVAGARQAGRNILQRIGTARPGEAPAVDDLLTGNVIEHGMIVLGGDTIVAVAGARRVGPVPGSSPAAIVTTPFARLLVVREQRGGREAQVAILLEAGSALPAAGPSLAARSAGWQGVQWAWSRGSPGGTESFATVDAAVQHLQDVMRPVPPTPEVVRAREVVVSRWLAAAGLLGLVLVVLASSAPPLVRVATFLVPTWAVARVLATPAVPGGMVALALLVGLALLMLAVVLWRRPARRTPIGTMASVLLLASAPPLVFAIGRELAPPVALLGTVGWFIWQAVLALGAAAWLGIAVAPLRGAGDEATGGRWGALATVLALLVGAAGIEAWTPAGWAWWLTPLGLLPLLALLPATTALTRRLAVVTLAAVLASLAAWGASLDERQHRAEADLDRLGARLDQSAALALERLGGTIRREGITRLDRLYAAWRASEVAALEAPTQLAVWVKGDPLEYVALDALSVSWTDLERLVERRPGLGRTITLARGSGRHDVLVVPMAGDTTITIAIGPRSRIVPPTRFGQLVGWRSPTEPAYTVRALPVGLTNADGIFRRTGRWIRADRLVEAGAAPIVARAEVEIAPPRPFAVRAAVTLVLDVLLILLAWTTCRRLLGGGGGIAPGVFRRSYRRTVATALAGFFLVPAVLFTAWSLLRLRQDATRERSAEVARVLRDAAVGGGFAVAERPVPGAAALAELADGVGADLAVYRRGRLLATSTPLLAELGLLAPVIDPALTRAAPGEASATLAGLPGVNLRLGAEPTGTPGTVLAAVLPGAEAQLAREQVDLALLLLLTSLGGGIAAVVVAGLVARALGQPIDALTRTALAIGRRQPVPDPGSPPAEFDPVFGAIAQMEGDLRASAAQLEAGRVRTEAILSTVATGVIGVAADGTVIHVNPRAEVLLGVPISRERPLAEQLPLEWAPVAEAVRRGLEPNSPGAESRELDLGARRAAVTVAPFQDGGLVLAITDITEASRAARVLAWGEMARQVAHEIKNPLTPMRLGLQHLQRLRADGRPEFAEQVDLTAERLLTEIDRLDRIARSFARYGAPPAEVGGPLEAVSLDAVVREVAELFALAAGEPRVTVTGEAGRAVAARREELIQVMLNLLDNARGADAAHVTIMLAPERIEVRDDGRGIAADQIERIFEPTFSTTTSGTGLGLAIVRRLVEGWGATIGVDSSPGEGTVLSIRFPVPASPTPVIGAA
jgi:signal transduction histidine kinase